MPTYQHAIPSDTYLTTLLAKPHFIALVAVQGCEVIGGIAAYVLEKFEQDRREIYIPRYAFMSRSAYAKTSII